MNRRGFLRSLVGGVAAAAAVRTFPFRVYSFPSEVRIAHDLAPWEDMTAFTTADLTNDLLYVECFTKNDIFRLFRHAGKTTLVDARANPHPRMPFVFVSP